MFPQSDFTTETRWLRGGGSGWRLEPVAFVEEEGIGFRSARLPLSDFPLLDDYTKM
jgi:hypothetical protein